MTVSLHVSRGRLPLLTPLGPVARRVSGRLVQPGPRAVRAWGRCRALVPRITPTPHLVSLLAAPFTQRLFAGCLRERGAKMAISPGVWHQCPQARGQTRFRLSLLVSVPLVGPPWASSRRPVGITHAVSAGDGEGTSVLLVAVLAFSLAPPTTATPSTTTTTTVRSARAPTVTATLSPHLLHLLRLRSLVRSVVGTIRPLLSRTTRPSAL